MDISISNQGLQTYQTAQTKKTDAVSSNQAVTSADGEVQKSLSIAYNTDRVEISSEGRAALAQEAVVSGDQVQAVQPAQDQTAQIAQTAARIAQSAQVAQAASQITGEASGESMEVSSMAAEAANSAADSDEAVLESASSSSTSSTNLTTLSEDEINDLVDDGTITQAEANAELTRRAQEKAMSEAANQTAEIPEAAEEAEAIGAAVISQGAVA